MNPRLYKYLLSDYFGSTLVKVVDVFIGFYTILFTIFGENKLSVNRNTPDRVPLLGMD